MGCIQSCKDRRHRQQSERPKSVHWNDPESAEFLDITNMADQDVADFLAAFEAGDKNKDGTLNTGEFIRLMVVLGVPGGADRARAVLRQINKNGDAVVTQQEYFQAIKQLSVPTTQIRQMKQIFDIFDHDQTGWASKKDVINGLGELGVPIEGELKENLEKLDANKDGKIWFPDFLRVQLNI